MTNPHIGEVTFEAGGKTYKFKMGTAAQVAIEYKSKKTVHILLKDLASWGMTELLMFFHAGLLRAHGLTEAEAGDILDELGTDRAGEIIGEALKLAYGGPDETTANPTLPKAANGGIGMAP